MDESSLNHALPRPAGDAIAEAERPYHEILRSDPRRADAWNFLGLLAIETARPQSAVEYLERAVALQASSAVYHNHLGVAAAGMKQLDRAIECFQRAVALDPQLADAHYNWGNVLRGLAKFDEAAGKFRAALAIVPNSHKMRYNLANTLRDLGQLNEAAVEYREALRIRPNYLRAYTNLGNIYKQQGRLDEAAAMHREAVRISPDYARGYYNLGVVLADAKRFPEAEAQHRSALACKADYHEARNALAAALVEQGKLDEAGAVLGAGPAGQEDQELQLRLAEKLRILRRTDEAAAIIEKVLQKAPTATAHNNMGLVRMSEGLLAEAVACYRQALEIQPDFAEVRNNLAVALELDRDRGGGVAELETALALRPDFNVAHLNRAVAWLRNGDFPRGWLEFEWRWLCEGHRIQKLAAPRWLGQPLPGRTILLHSEQGLGDTIQFIRYAPLVHERCGRVLVQCHKPLKRLLARCPSVDELLAADDPLPEHHAQLPLMSLPRVFATTLASVPRGVPYVFADEALVRAWRERLAAIAGFRVGIVWQGNSVYAGDAFRSLPLRHFAPLARLPGVSLVSLQKGFGAEQLREAADPFPVVALDPAVDEAAGAFMDTAAIMSNLDLVVSSDTAIVHLAGAMGVPVWVALGWSADWRWLEERSDSPWYPSMRLFRQTRLGDWDEVFARIAQELLAVSSGDAARLRPPARSPSTAGSDCS